MSCYQRITSNNVLFLKHFRNCYFLFSFWWFKIVLPYHGVSKAAQPFLPFSLPSVSSFCFILWHLRPACQLLANQFLLPCDSYSTRKLMDHIWSVHVHLNHLPEAFRKKLTMVTYVISVPDFKSAVPQDAQTPAPAAWPPPLDRWACLNSPPRPPSAATAAPPRGRRALRTLMHIKFGWYAIFKPHQIRNHKRLPHLSIYMRHRFSASHVTRVHFSFTVSIPNVLFSLSYFWLAL